MSWSNDLLAQMILGHLFTFFEHAKINCFLSDFHNVDHSVGPFIHLDCRSKRQRKCTKKEVKKENRRRKRKTEWLWEMEGDREHHPAGHFHSFPKEEHCAFSRTKRLAKRNSQDMHTQTLWHVSVLLESQSSAEGWKNGSLECFRHTVPLLCVCLWQSEPWSGGVGADAGLCEGRCTPLCTSGHQRNPAAIAAAAAAVKKAAPGGELFIADIQPEITENTEDTDVGMGIMRNVMILSLITIQCNVSWSFTIPLTNQF